jgi:ketosteroid isomerase-like protein
MRYLKAYDRDLTSYYEEVIVSGNLAVGRGVAIVELEPRGGGPAETATSKYINVLKKQDDGTWITTHDIWNPDD